MKKVAEIKEATGIDLTGWSATSEDVSAALKFAMSAKPFNRYGGVPGAIREMEGALKRMQDIQALLTEFMPPEAEPRVRTTKKKSRAGALAEI
jgi:hypothetical protein